MPQITKIMTMLREKGYPVSSGVLTVEQGVQEILRILGRRRSPVVSNITLGQYVPGKSFLHRMDARVKIVLIIAFIVLVFVGQNYPALGIVVVSVLGVMAFSNVPVKLYFKSLRMIILW